MHTCAHTTHTHIHILSPNHSLSQTHIQHTNPISSSWLCECAHTCAHTTHTLSLSRTHTHPRSQSLALSNPHALRKPNVLKLARRVCAHARTCAHTTHTLSLSHTHTHPLPITRPLKHTYTMQTQCPEASLSARHELDIFDPHTHKPSRQNITNTQSHLNKDSSEYHKVLKMTYMHVTNSTYSTHTHINQVVEISPTHKVISIRNHVNTTNKHSHENELSRCHELDIFDSLTHTPSRQNITNTQSHLNKDPCEYHKHTKS